MKTGLPMQIHLYLMVHTVYLSWKHNGEMDFIKNENYWDADSVKTEKMNWPISESQSTRLTLVEGGEADMTVEPPVADQND